MEFDLGRLLTEESKRMMNCLHEGIFIADKMGNIVFANQALLEMAGGTEEYALSLNVFDFKKQGVDVNKDQLLAQTIFIRVVHIFIYILSCILGQFCIFRYLRLSMPENFRIAANC